METAEMRRSTLQRKDRDELTEIATTLGKKPSSRARKGEIIDLILDLAAGGDGSSVGGDANDDASEGDGASDAPESVDAESPAEAPVAKDKPSRGGRGGAKASSGNSDGDATGDNARQTKGDKAAADSGDRTEPGNRRRRRRGRDRDNTRDGNESWDGEPVAIEGHLDLRGEGYGFIRVAGYLPSRDDAYVPVKLVRQFDLRKGDVIAGPSRPANRNEKNPALLSVDTVNGGPPEAAAKRAVFDNLTPVHPSQRFDLSSDVGGVTGRLVDLLAPIGKGQRAIVVAPPKAGKTRVVHDIVGAIEANHADVEVMVLLVEERPEEVTAMKRVVQRGEVVSSTFDRPADEHVAVAELTVERAKRLVEEGKDVVLVLDGISRLARAYNHEAPQNGKVMAGGIDTSALHLAKRLMGAARAMEEGGSLTIIATLNADTGVAFDEVVLEEFAQTANLEIRLNGEAAERRIWPAFDPGATSARHEELLYDDSALAAVTALRRSFVDTDAGPVALLEDLLARIAGSKTNDELLRGVASAASAS